MDKRVNKAPDTRRRHAEDFKLALVRRSLEPGASVAAIAQEAGVNANLLFNWRRLHQKAHRSADAAPAPVLLPVTVMAPELTAAPPPTSSSPAPRHATAGTIEIDIKGVHVRVRGAIDEASIRAVLRALACVA
jgi:transposase